MLEDEELDPELELDGMEDMGGGPPIWSVKAQEDGEAPRVATGGVSALTFSFPDLLPAGFQPLLVFVIV